jgi:hypothetical protein
MVSSSLPSNTFACVPEHFLIRAFMQNPKYTSKWCRNKTRADMYILGGLLFMWGYYIQLSISRFGSRFTKKPDFDTLKMQKALFVRRNKNRHP